MATNRKRQSMKSVPDDRIIRVPVYKPSVKFIFFLYLHFHIRISIIISIASDWMVKVEKQNTFPFGRSSSISTICELL